MSNDGWTIPGGGNSFPFDNAGDWVRGTVTEFEPNLPQTEFDGPNKGQPRYYSSGAPMVMHRIGLTVIESSAPGIAAGASVSVYMKGKMKPTATSAEGQPQGSTNAVVTAAIQAATGSNQLMPNSELTLQLVGDEPRENRTDPITKRYAAWYKLGAIGAIPSGPTQAAPVASQPVATAAAQPVMQASPSPTAAVPVAAGPGTLAMPPATTPTAAPVAPPAPATASGSVELPPEALAAIAAAQAAQAAQDAGPAWDADPRVAPMRAAGVDDETIRRILAI